MRLFPLLLLGSTVLASAGGAPADGGGPPVCNGKHKRPANLYGSVLSEGPRPDAAAAPGVGVGVKPTARGSAIAAPPPVADARSAEVSPAALRASFARCGTGGRA